MVRAARMCAPREAHALAKLGASGPHGDRVGRFWSVLKWWHWSELTERQRIP